jgi:hypothetical protein
MPGGGMRMPPRPWPKIISVQDNVIGKMVINLRIVLSRLLKRKGKDSFIKILSPNSSVLDVGCGNNSPYRFKTQRPDIYYIGLDICDYCQSTNPLAGC